MSQGSQSIPFRASAPNKTVPGLQYKPRHTPLVQDVSHISSTPVPEHGDYSIQGNFSYSSNAQYKHRKSSLPMEQWSGSASHGLLMSPENVSNFQPAAGNLNCAYNAMTTESFAPESQMFSFSSVTQPMVSATSQFAHDPMVFSEAPRQHIYSTMGDFSFDPSFQVNKPQNCTSPTLAGDDVSGFPSAQEIDENPLVVGRSAWNDLSMDPVDVMDQVEHLPANLVQSLPISPPLSEASTDVSVVSSCQQTSYLAQDQLFSGKHRANMLGHDLSIGFPMRPLTPPYHEQPQEASRSEMPDIS